LKNRLSPVESRNRKPLRLQADFKEEWELRFGPDNRFHGTKTESEYKNRPPRYAFLTKQDLMDKITSKY
jgi:hypothetical protein